MIGIGKVSLQMILVGIVILHYFVMCVDQDYIANAKEKIVWVYV